ncbi:MAG: hypothetical protein GWN84_08460 [Gammaproteobacteria bacterium]|nr:hypothetical protein [Gammaproteobacteria bacterium]NIR82900.1 hypothetical protein [Gammaproteobacteria bacterium]NIR90168.1 hypothetical protein [Gammaproteobacteria bacterium]NIU03727.1 hypothetical protein [Gammaproteobacteria bacterium]NIX85001.1 hypothetical protein [Gammaproteobacteria bacterium]
MAVNAYQRLVRCRNKDCGAVLDPYQVLRQLSHDWDAATHYSAMLQEQQHRLESLRREEHCVKARLRRIKAEREGLERRHCFRCRRETHHDEAGVCLGCEPQEESR